MTAFDTRADGKSACKSDHRAESGMLRPRPAVTIPLYLEHVFSLCRNRTDRRVLWSPVLKFALYRASLQDHADAIAWVQPREGLPVVPVLSVHRYGKRA
jgi:hypothetical protein